MRLFITIEAQNSTENGLAKILKEIVGKLDFLTNESRSLENENNYGTEFREISIIPSCMDDKIWLATGWKERKQIWRKKGEADIRLRMNYERFVMESEKNKYLLFVDIVIKSIRVVQDKSIGDFDGDKLIKDILSALTISENEIVRLNADNVGKIS